jgi:hypothetical protein
VLKPILVALSLTLLSGTLGGCSKCDWFKSDPQAGYQACR